MRSSEWNRSAGAIVSGIVLFIVGQFVFQLGQQSALRASLTAGSYGDDEAGKVPMILGGVLLLAGLITLGWGVWQMATNVDLAAFVASRRLKADEQEAEREVAATIEQEREARRAAADALAARRSSDEPPTAGDGPQ